MLHALLLPRMLVMFIGGDVSSRSDLDDDVVNDDDVTTFSPLDVVEINHHW